MLERGKTDTPNIQIHEMCLLSFQIKCIQFFLKQFLSAKDGKLGYLSRLI